MQMQGMQVVPTTWDNDHLACKVETRKESREETLATNAITAF